LARYRLNIADYATERPQLHVVLESAMGSGADIMLRVLDGKIRGVLLVAAHRKSFEVLDEIVVGLREAAKSAPVLPAPPPPGNRRARRAAKAQTLN
jgi:hypothetical protein